MRKAWSADLAWVVCEESCGPALFDLQNHEGSSPPAYRNWSRAIRAWEDGGHTFYDLVSTAGLHLANRDRTN